MIKLNLLPQYVIEIRRIRVVVILFLVLLGLEGGIVYKAYADLQSQIDWFTTDKDYFTQRTAVVKAEKAITAGLETNTKIYGPYIDFFSREAIVKYNDDLATSIETAANTISGGPQEPMWFDLLSVGKTGDVSATGRIKGMINFLDYYFRMKEAQFTLTPQAQPAPSPAEPTLNDELSVVVSGKIAKVFPNLPGMQGDKPALPSELYKPAGGAAPAAGAPRPGGPAVPR